MPRPRRERTVALSILQSGFLSMYTRSHPHRGCYIQTRVYIEKKRARMYRTCRMYVCMCVRVCVYERVRRNVRRVVYAERTTCCATRSLVSSLADCPSDHRRRQKRGHERTFLFFFLSFFFSYSDRVESMKTKSAP